MSGPVPKHHNLATGRHPYASAGESAGHTATRNPDSTEGDHTHPGFSSKYNERVHHTDPSKQGPMQHGEHGHEPMHTFHGKHGHPHMHEHHPDHHHGGHRHFHRGRK